MERIKENRERFFARLVHLPREDRLRIELAYTLAKFGHRAQVRKERDPSGQPLRYFEHPRRVALILLDEVGITLPDLIISALIHDGLEDTRDLTRDVIEFHFGEEPCRIVSLLSKVPKEGFLFRLSTYADWPVLLVKAADRLDNLRTMDHASDEFIVKQINETRQVYYPLFAKLGRTAPQEWAEPINALIAKITRQVDDLAARPTVAAKLVEVAEATIQLVPSWCGTPVPNGPVVPSEPRA